MILLIIIIGAIAFGKYIFVTTISSNGWEKFYKGYDSSQYLTKVSQMLIIRLTLAVLTLELVHMPLRNIK